MTEPKDTRFLSAKRSDPEQVASERSLIQKEPMLQKILDCMPNIVLILDGNRQLVCANKRLAEFLGRPLEHVLGKRPGEILACVHAGCDGDGLCGTTEFCTQCGAAQTLQSVLLGKARSKECRLWVRQKEHEQALTCGSPRSPSRSMERRSPCSPSRTSPARSGGKFWRTPSSTTPSTTRAPS